MVAYTFKNVINSTNDVKEPFVYLCFTVVNIPKKLYNTSFNDINIVILGFVFYHGS